MRTGIRVAFVAFGWLLGLLLFGICALHQSQELSTSWECALVAASPWLLMLGIPLLAVAAAARRKILATVAAVIVVCWGFWALPDFWPFWSSPPGGPTVVRLFDANVSQANRNLDEIAGEILRAHPSVVTLEELTPPAYASLNATRVLARFRYRMVLAKAGAGGMGVWSTIPLLHLQSWTNDPGQEEIEGVLHPLGAPAITLDAVHVFAPVFGPDEPETWLSQIDAVRSHVASQRGALIVAGDFNATWDMHPFQAFLQLGLSDAAVLAGDGWQMTWPRDQHWVIPYLRLDHVLLSRQLTIHSYRLGTGVGSDHRPLIVSVAFRIDHRRSRG